jgi:hypothetical protein
MYEVHPDGTGKWVLYVTGDGGFDVIAWFAERNDAEFARSAFEQRGDGSPLTADDDVHGLSAKTPA